MTDDEKDWIDNASYRELLERWRFSPAGDLIFADEEAAEYYADIMAEKKKFVDSVTISKELGFGSSNQLHMQHYEQYIY